MLNETVRPGGGPLLGINLSRELDRYVSVRRVRGWRWNKTTFCDQMTVSWMVQIAAVNPDPKK